MDSLMRTRIVIAAMLALAAPLLAVVVATPAVAVPMNVSVPGSFNSEIGCASDWNPGCTEIQLVPDASSELWTLTVTIPAGTWDYNIFYDITFGPFAGQRSFTLATSTDVTFYYNAYFDRFGSSADDTIVTAVGNFQSELGCSSDWNAGCARSALLKDGTGGYSLVVTSLPAGIDEAKAWHDFGAGAIYGEGGDSPGDNILFTVLTGQTVIFSYDLPSHVLTVTAESPGIDLGVPELVPGGTLTADLIGFVPGETVAVDLDGTPIFTGTADEFGRASFSVTIAAGTPLGASTVTANGATSQRVATQGLTIVAPAALAETGVDIVPMGLLGALLLAAGTLVTLARRHYAEAE